MCWFHAWAHSITLRTVFTSEPVDLDRIAKLPNICWPRREFARPLESKSAGQAISASQSLYCSPCVLLDDFPRAPHLFEAGLQRHSLVFRTPDRDGQRVGSPVGTGKPRERILWSEGLRDCLDQETTNRDLGRLEERILRIPAWSIAGGDLASEFGGRGRVHETHLSRERAKANSLRSRARVQLGDFEIPLSSTPSTRPLPANQFPVGRWRNPEAEIAEKPLIICLQGISVIVNLGGREQSDGAAFPGQEARYVPPVAGIIDH